MTHVENLRPAVRITRVFLPVANWRATASMPKVPLPGTSTADWA